MRIALISDIHGNLTALQAVIDDIANQGGVDMYLALGDYVVQGNNPIGVLETLTSLQNIFFIRGNTDRSVATGSWPGPSAEDVQEKPELLSTLLGISKTFSWTHGALSATNWLRWMKALPLEYRVTLPDKTRLLAVHSSPGRDDGRGVRPNASCEELKSMFEGCRDSLVVVGHTHWFCEHRLSGLHVVNVGSVSNHISRDLRASYVILDTYHDGYHITHRLVDYDRRKLADDIQNSGHPTADFLIDLILHGESWPF